MCCEIVEIVENLYLQDGCGALIVACVADGVLTGGDEGHVGHDRHQLPPGPHPAQVAVQPQGRGYYRRKASLCWLFFACANLGTIASDYEPDTRFHGLGRYLSKYRANAHRIEKFVGCFGVAESHQ